MMRRLTLVSILLVTAVLKAQPIAIPQLFQRGKEEFKRGAFTESLATFMEIDRLSQKRGMEQDRVKLLPIIAFYRGANMAALGRQEEAAKELGRYLELVPTARIEASNFHPAVVEAFERARSSRIASGQRSNDMSAVYAQFRGQPESTEVTEQWAQSAVRYLLTKEETAAWSAADRQSVRQSFVDAFWKRRDPTSETVENELRTEIERRMQFADAMFAAKNKSGRETDRGLVFVLMGPPTNAAQARLTNEDDNIETYRAAAGFRSLSTDVQQGTREAWYYRGERIPGGMKYRELRFDFITKEGYGSSVLQKEARTLQALDQAARMVNESKSAL